MAICLARRVTFKNFAVVKPAAAWFRDLRAGNFEYSTKNDTVDDKAHPAISEPISGPTGDIKSAILKSALDFIPQHGWTWKSIAAGASSLGYSSVAHGLFPGGSVDLITYFYLSSNDELEHQLESSLHKTERRAVAKGKSAFIQDAVWRRILLIEPYKTKWVQMSWYSKRAALAALYQSSELVFLQDKSTDYTQTQEFLDRRIKEFAAVSNCLEQVNQVSGTAKDVVELGFATLKNVLGMNTR
ncbi:ubiquinone biosynthesis protein COQ9, mitochondrial isoform X4 [Rhipicephalus sanguineus]|uniref:ubiquinone biosynthesis protein COQ9, mitochondrial isoform X4 n=1 Tax=Rhipicephalus sanguineus TaxID=34632 RepID=UPI0020C46709|nr:ubiquinone biosynthesis protein COQ9, mitochondrial isoform X4 [Rhipicephalus sanguineus]